MEAFKIDLYSLTGLNKDIDIKTNLLNKTWRVFNDSDIKETCIFSEDGKLTIVKDGQETTMSWKIKGSKIKIGKEKLYPSYKDNILFVFSIPEHGNVFLINEQNGLSIIPKTKQDLYDYFQKADLIYNRFNYPVYISQTPIYWYYIWSFVAIITIPLAYLFLFCKLAERILVEFGVDSNSILSFAIIAFAILLAALPINALNKRYSLAQNRKNEHDLLISKKQWIKNNLNDERWKQYGYSLFIFCPYGRLKRPFSLEWNACYLGSLHIGFYDKGITTRDQLLKVDKAIRELRKSLCYNVNQYVYVTILTIIALLTFTLTIMLIMKYGEQLPYFSFEGNLWGLNIFPTLIYYFAPTLVVTFCFDYIFYKMNQRKLRKWIANNPNDWRKKYVMYKNYFDYKKWKESQ